MKIRSDVVGMYRDIHSWVGIVAGLALFIPPNKSAAGRTGTLTST